MKFKKKTHKIDDSYNLFENRVCKLIVNSDKSNKTYFLKEL